MGANASAAAAVQRPADFALRVCPAAVRLPCAGGQDQLLSRRLLLRRCRAPAFPVNPLLLLVRAPLLCQPTARAFCGPFVGAGALPTEERFGGDERRHHKSTTFPPSTAHSTGNGIVRDQSFSAFCKAEERERHSWERGRSCAVAPERKIKKPGLAQPFSDLWGGHGCTGPRVLYVRKLPLPRAAVFNFEPSMTT